MLYKVIVGSVGGKGQIQYIFRKVEMEASEMQGSGYSYKRDKLQ